MKIANRYSDPAVPDLDGPQPRATAAPRRCYSGSVVLDLKRMNKILEVDERNAYALVEPGVSYFDLYRYIRSTSSRSGSTAPIPAGAA